MRHGQFQSPNDERIVTQIESNGQKRTFKAENHIGFYILLFHVVGGLLSLIIRILGHHGLQQILK